MMQSFAMMGLVTILWAICGYSLAFGHGNMFVGGFEHLFLRFQLPTSTVSQRGYWQSRFGLQGGTFESGLRCCELLSWEQQRNGQSGRSLVAARTG
jgi:ammonia channel protein AmtB